MKRTPLYKTLMDAVDPKLHAHQERLDLINRPFPPIRLINEQPRSYTWAGCGISRGAGGGRRHKTLADYDDSSNR